MTSNRSDIENLTNGFDTNGHHIAISLSPDGGFHGCVYCKMTRREIAKSDKPCTGDKAAVKELLGAVKISCDLAALPEEIVRSIMESGLRNNEDSQLAAEARARFAASGVVPTVNGKSMAAMTDAELARHERRSRQRFNDMVESGKAPRVKSDDTFFRGFTGTGGAQFSDEVRPFYLEEAKKAGVSVSGKQYFSELAAYPGDPRAWVSSRGEMKQLLEERGWSADGDIKVKGEAPEPAGPVRLADDIAEDMALDALEDRFPDRESFTREEVAEAKAEAVEAHAPSY